MATVLPFPGLRYNKDKTGGLRDVTAPPYDVIDEARRADYAEASPYNVVRLILPQQDEAPGAADKYDAAARILAEWKSEGIIVRDSAPALYRYRQDFTAPGSTKADSREGLIAAVRLHAFDEGIILPHEKTLAGPKKDRLALTDATTTNLSPTFSFYFDPQGKIRGALGEAGEPWTDFTDSDGVRHRLWAVTDPKVHEAVKSAFEKMQLYIADGHHRYTTALHYRDVIRERSGGTLPENHPANFMMMFVAEAAEMTVLPYHRMLLAGAGVEGRKRAPAVLANLGALFHDERLSTKTSAERDAFMKKLLSSTASHAFAIVGSGHAHLLTAKDKAAVEAAFDASVPGPVRALDVAALHDLLLAKEFGLTTDKIAEGGIFKYSPDANKVFENVESDAAELGFLLRPTKLEQVRDVSQAGEVMPQKSTYFYPKLGSGLVFRDLHP